MPCKFLIKVPKRMPLEIGPGGPQVIALPDCYLKRQPGERQIGGITNCEEIPSDGPCWVWKEEVGNKPDVQFSQTAPPLKR